MDTRNKVIVMIIFSCVLTGIGMIFLVYGALEVYHVQNNIPDERTIPLSPQSRFPYLDDPYSNETISIFKTNDVFAVNNEIKGQVKIYVKNSSNIQQIVGIIVTKLESNIEWANGSNELIAKHLDLLAKDGGLAIASPSPNEKNVYNIFLDFKPSSETSQSIWIFLHIINGTWWHYYTPIDLPTIEPASSLVQIKNNRIIEGLTWAIIGLVPIGLVAQFWITYLIENHFYRKT